MDFSSPLTRGQKPVETEVLMNILTNKLFALRCCGADESAAVLGKQRRREPADPRGAAESAWSHLGASGFLRPEAQNLLNI